MVEHILTSPAVTDEATAQHSARLYIAAAVVAKLAGRDDKPCRRKSNVIEAIAYADDLLRRLAEVQKML